MCACANSSVRVSNCECDENTLLMVAYLQPDIRVGDGQSFDSEPTGGIAGVRSAWQAVVYPAEVRQGGCLNTHAHARAT